MNNPVSLKSIVEELDLQLEEWRSFINKTTGELISVPSDDLRAAEEEEPFSHLPDWQQEDRKMALNIINDFDNFIELSTKYDVNEYEIMEGFCLSAQEPVMKKTLLNVIKGKGAFRRFKDTIINLGIEEQWYS